MESVYINYQKASLKYDPDTHAFTCGWGSMGRFLTNGHVAGIMAPGRGAPGRGVPGRGASQWRWYGIPDTVSAYRGKGNLTLSDFKKIDTESEDLPDGRRLTVKCTQGPAHLPDLNLVFTLTKNEILFDVRLWENCTLTLEGDLLWGEDMATSTFACRLDRKIGDLRVACGPAASRLDNALFDRLTDSAVEIMGPAELRMRYCWDKQRYRFQANTGTHALTRRVRFRFHDNYFARKFSVPYRPVRGETQFKTPPVGWMTWYAVKFAASEKTVLENARWQSQNLKPFGANCLWVDWEWYHSRVPSAGEYPDVDTFSPNHRAYPNGLELLSGEIKKLGLVPALWIGATNDPNRNRLLEAHPDWILAEKGEWCGRWWIDPSHPQVVESYIPAVFRQLLDWGFEAFKWDCIPSSLQIADRFHDSFHDCGKTSEQALREVIRAAREVIGPHRYMMSCSGHGFRDITLAIDVFDGGRIGGDIFSWEEYIKQAVARAMTYLCFNNILFYADMDNVVIRGEYNNMDQAVSRVSFSGLSGTPVTLGDNLPDLAPERVELLKRIMPVPDLHPMDLDHHTQDLDVVILNLLVAKEFEAWNVVDVFNTTEQAKTVHLDLAGDLHLDSGEGESYLVYDFWRKSFLGRWDSALDLDLPPYGSTVLCLRPYQDRPQVLSTSRHITQGAHDLDSVKWEERSLTLTGVSKVVAGDPYEIWLHSPGAFEPDGPVGPKTAELVGLDGGVWKLATQPHKTGPMSWSVSFKKT